MKDFSFFPLRINHSVVFLLFAFLSACNGHKDPTPAFNETLFFSADDGQSGQELWRSDGTAANTFRVSDINRLEQGSHPQQFVEVNGVLFYVADDGKSGRELWKYQIVSGEASLVKNISPSSHVAPDYLTVFGDTLFFTADDGVHGRELWKSDGTEAGTVMVSDLYHGEFGSMPEDLVVTSKRLFFTAKTAATDRDLWVTDGTAAGTVLLKDFQHLVDDNGFTRLTQILATASLGDRLFFILSSSQAGSSGLWVSNGEANGTLRLVESPAQLFNISSTPLTVVGEQVFFSDINLSSEPSLWKTDGTVEGSVLVKHESVRYSTALGDRLFFFANGNELWVSDGSESGTSLIHSAFTPGVYPSANVSTLVFNDQLYFLMSSDSLIHSSANRGVELWRSDGTDAGTVLIQTIKDDHVNLIHDGLLAFGNELIFKIMDQNFNQILWKSDGTQSGTIRIATIQTATERDQNPVPVFFSFAYEMPVWQDVIAIDDHLYFAADDTATGFEIWTSDGTVEGSTQLVNINRSTQSAFADDFFRHRGVYLDNNYYFIANDGVHGFELWRTDGSEQGTVMLKDVYTGISSSNPGSLTVMNGSLFFMATENNEYLPSLWRSDGTQAGTIKLKDLGQSVFYPGLTVYHDHLYFADNQSDTGEELWRTDGTIDGTKLVIDLFPGYADSYLDNLIVYADRLFFSARDSYDDQESLWSSDGTEVGTKRVKNFSSLNDLFTNNGLLYLLADDGSGPGLWKSDGSEQGTVSAFTFPTDSANYQFVGRNEQFVFLLEEPSFLSINFTGLDKLWSSNGTVTGTSLIKDISLNLDLDKTKQLMAVGDVTAALKAYREVIHMPGFTSMDNWFYFTGGDDQNLYGHELWVSDGTPGNTQQFKDIYSGIASSYPESLTRRGATVYFSANDGEHGSELWQTDGTAGGTSMVLDIKPGRESSRCLW